MTIDTGVQKVFGHAPVVPHDESELRHILTLIEKVPLYLEKMTELTARVQEFAKIASQQTAPLTYSYEIERMIFRAFFIELENSKSRRLGTAPLL